MAAALTELVASGDNFTMHIDRGVVVLRVWSRRDMSFARGAALAQAKLDHLRQLVTRPDVSALIFDLIDAPAVIGPVTEQAVRAMIGVFAEHGHAVAVLVGERPMQTLQFSRLVREVCGTKNGHDLGLVTPDRVAAEAFVRRAAPNTA